MNAGDVVGGRYRLVEPVASGGMGTVWRARHTELDVDVALKVMSDALLRAPTALGRFQREARAAAQLKSPHVVQVFDYGIHDGQPYLAMELLEGEDLRAHLERTGPLPLGRAAQLLDAIARALRLAHAAGIVHRDLKPANIFLHQSADEEVLKVLDFGIAKDLSPQVDGLRTSTATVVGSPLYMSPEQVRGGDVDHRTDLWSIATLTFEMVTGRNPFEGASLGDVFARIVADAVPRPTSSMPGLPASVDTFFERALARAPADRYGSATELAAAFRASIGSHVDDPARSPAGPRSRVRVDAPTIAAPIDTGSGERAQAAGDGGEDDVGSAPTERPDGWPTSAGARTAPRAVAEPPLRTEPPETDTGPVAERRPRPRRHAPALMAGGLVIALGLVAAHAWRDRGAPPGAVADPRAPPTRLHDERRPVPSVAPADAAPPASAAAPPAPEAARAAPDAAPPTPAASTPPSATPPPTSAALSPPARAPAGGPVVAPAAPSAPAPGRAIDPIFGVPVGPP